MNIHTKPRTPFSSAKPTEEGLFWSGRFVLVYFRSGSTGQCDLWTALQRSQGGVASAVSCVRAHSTSSPWCHGSFDVSCPLGIAHQHTDTVRRGITHSLPIAMLPSLSTPYKTLSFLEGPVWLHCLGVMLLHSTWRDWLV